jgi:hypothetical protein
MIPLTKNTRVKLMTIHGLAMLALGIALFYIRATMTDLFSYVFGGALAVLLIASSLLFIAGLDWICATLLGYRHVHTLWRFLLLSTTAGACIVLLILYPGSTIRILCYVQAVYAFSLSLGKFYLARLWNGTKREQATTYFLAVVALAFSGSLVVFAGKGDAVSLAVVATYYLFMGVEMLVTMYLLRQRALQSVEPASAV